MQLKNVPRLSGINIGGSTRLLYASVDMINAAAWPQRTHGTLNMIGNISFTGSDAFFYIDPVRESIGTSDKIKSQGAYDHGLGCFVAGDNAEMSALFDAMHYKRFILLRKDANGHWCVKGTPSEPLSFSYRKVSRDRMSQLKGYELDFSGLCSKPELYYTGSVMLRSSIDDNVRVTIDGNFRTIID